MERAAIYLRSSKDRHDVAPDAQRRELMALATSRGLTVVETFHDAVERADDENRPGFQALLRSLKSADRQWDHLLVMDTARIARNNQHLASAFNYECEKRGIKLIYSKLPETNTVMDVVFRQVARAFDQLHSLMSKEKGLGGMAENVRQGWRAGGRAPLGYKLSHVPTGAVRDGAEVTKSRLVRGDLADEVQAYLKARVAGMSRPAAIAESGLTDLNPSTLVGMEWNALTYAGHTVWNVHAERVDGGGYKGGSKRRPRSDWVINYDTHEPLISTDEAEQLVSKLDTGRPKAYRTKSDYLLSGLLKTPDGKAWHADGEGFYRVGKGRRVRRDLIERAVMAALGGDLVSDEFVRELVAEAQRISAPPPDSKLKDLRKQVSALTAKIDRLASLAAETDAPRPFLDQIEANEKNRMKLVAELASLELDQEAADVLRAVSAADVKAMLAIMAEHIATVDREAMKEMLHGLLETVELCPTSLAARLHYRFATGELLASPRRSPQIPALRVVRSLLLAA